MSHGGSENPKPPHTKREKKKKKELVRNHFTISPLLNFLKDFCGEYLDSVTFRNSQETKNSSALIQVLNEERLCLSVQRRRNMLLTATQYLIKKEHRVTLRSETCWWIMKKQKKYRSKKDKVFTVDQLYDMPIALRSYACVLHTLENIKEDQS